MMMTGCMQPTGTEYEHCADRNRNETTKYQKLQDVANNNNDYSNSGNMKDPNGRRLNGV
jgi:hypothetical protein